MFSALMAIIPNRAYSIEQQPGPQSRPDLVKAAIDVVKSLRHVAHQILAFPVEASL